MLIKTYRWFLCIIGLFFFLFNLLFYSDNRLNIYRILKQSLEHSSNNDVYVFNFTILIILITSIILVYSVSYIDINNIYRFLLIIFIFSLSILIFISSTNIFSLILGWDGLGITSFLLVFFYSSKINISPRVITILINRVGDVCLVISIIFIIKFFSFHDYKMYNTNILWYFVIFTAITKSAQFPFRAWLPAAIAAPTPTSALVHSSTLVTAGVYLVSKYSTLFNYEIKNSILFIASLTLFIARVSTISNWDIKKIIALSTLSQLSVIFLILFMIDEVIIIYHLINHALFKALLFIRIGWVIYNENRNQEFRFTRVNYISNPLILSSLYISLFCLIGLPFSAAFYSKHYFRIYIRNGYYNFFFFIGSFFLLITTILYSVKLYIMLRTMTKFKTFKIKTLFIIKQNYRDHSLNILTLLCLLIASILNYMIILKVHKVYLVRINFNIIYIYILIDVVFLSIIVLPYVESNFYQSRILYIQTLIRSTILVFNLIKKKIELLDTLWFRYKKISILQNIIIKNSYLYFYFFLRITLILIVIFIAFIIS